VTWRVKELIIQGGENIYPAEVERVLLGCRGVVDVVVAGVPHEVLGRCRTRSSCPARQPRNHPSRTRNPKPGRRPDRHHLDGMPLPRRHLLTRGPVARRVPGPGRHLRLPRRPRLGLHLRSGSRRPWHIDHPARRLPARGRGLRRRPASPGTPVRRPPQRPPGARPDPRHCRQLRRPVQRPDRAQRPRPAAGHPPGRSGIRWGGWGWGVRSRRWG
jgi:hypothetical protein